MKQQGFAAESESARMHPAGLPGREARMATLRCPRCDSGFSVGEGWAKSALSTLIAAPAVPDMATQVRCPKCQYLFAEGEVRHLRSSWSTGLDVVLLLLALAVIAWLVR